MTLVNFTLTSDTADGTRIPARGALRFVPTARREVAGEVVLPISFTAPLVDGVAVVDLEPTDPEWAWRIDEHVTGAVARTIWAAVPDVPQIDYTDLVELDPKTLAPTAEPTAAWAAALTEADTRLSAGTLTPDPDDPGFFLIGA